MSELAYCPSCRKSVHFDTRQSRESTELDGVVYEYPVQQAICRECGSREAVYQPYQEAAGRAFSEAVRTSRGLVPLDKVQGLPKKYRIGKRPLSLLLGWGELTYTRFMDGHVPSKEYSDVITRLYDDPSAYYRVLARGKDRIADVAYRKSAQAVEEILADSFSDATRIYEVADYFCELSEGDITLTMLQKLTYYTQGFSYVFLDAPLFDQEPEAWSSGPVYERLVREFQGKDLESEFAGALSVAKRPSPFSAEEEQLLKEVFDSFGEYSGRALSRMAQEERPWLEARSVAGDPEKGRHVPISLDSMKDFFALQVQRYGMRGVQDIGLYAKASFASSVG